jgi:RNA polymerase sigma-70 factor (ECF subfamily)
MVDTSKAARSTTDGESSPQADAPQVSVADLVREFHQLLYGHAYRLTGSVADAEDLTQQTYLIAQQRLDQLRDPMRARAWLSKILRNCFFKRLRKQSPQPMVDLGLDADVLPGEVPAKDDIDRELLQLALNELPAEFRVVLTMFYYERAAYKDIAAELEIPIGTVMSRLSRAKEYLRRRLLQETPTPSGATRR